MIAASPPLMRKGYASPASAAYSEIVRRFHGKQSDRAYAAVAQLDLPPAVFKTCPWQPRELIDTGLRQWLRCCAAALTTAR